MDMGCLVGLAILLLIASFVAPAISYIRNWSAESILKFLDRMKVRLSKKKSKPLVRGADHW